MVPERTAWRRAMIEFHYKGWDLFEAIDAVKAYDGGATDSGVGDEAMRDAIRVYLQNLPADELRRVCSLYARRYLTDEAIDRGYGLRDIEVLIEWLDENSIAY